MIHPVQIRRPDVAEDVRKLAELMGVSMTDAVAAAVRGRLAIEQVNADKKLRKRREAALKTLAHLRRLPVTGPAITDEDLYDENGLPK